MMTCQSLPQKATPKQGPRCRTSDCRVRCFQVFLNDYGNSPLKVTKPDSELPAGQRRIIIPSRKAKAAAGITSGKDDSGSKPDNKAQVGQKHKKTINTKV